MAAKGFDATGPMAAKPVDLPQGPNRYSAKEGKTSSSNSADNVAKKINGWTFLGAFLVIGAIGATAVGSLGLFNVVALTSLTASKIILASGISSFVLSFFAFAKGSKNNSLAVSNDFVETKLSRDFIDVAKKGDDTKILK